MKIVSWNVNGLRAVIRSGNLAKMIEREKPDIICMQEIKIQKKGDCEDSVFHEYPYKYFNVSWISKGYSGTAIWLKKKPDKVTYGIGEDRFDHEGRVLTVTMGKMHLVNVYVPNSGEHLQRLDFRVNDWDNAFEHYLARIKGKLVVCGDLNVAHHPIDIHDPKANLKSPGFTERERRSFTELLATTRLIDSYRERNKGNEDVYTFWSYMNKARQKNKGWRIDYFLCDKKTDKDIKSIDVLPDLMGSDHAPIYMILK